MENLTRLNTQVDALIAALHGIQDENQRLQAELTKSQAAGVEKDENILSLEIAREDQEQRIITLEDTMSKKDAYIEQLIVRIEQILSALPQLAAPTEQVYVEANT